MLLELIGLTAGFEYFCMAIHLLLRGPDEELAGAAGNSGPARWR